MKKVTIIYLESESEIYNSNKGRDGFMGIRFTFDDGTELRVDFSPEVEGLYVNSSSGIVVKPGAANAVTIIPYKW